MAQPGLDDVERLIGRAVTKLKGRPDKREVKRLVVKFLRKKHQVAKQEAKALFKQALKPGRGWQVLDGSVVREQGRSDSMAAASEQPADTSLQGTSQQEQQRRAGHHAKSQLQVPAAKASKAHALATAGAAARARTAQPAAPPAAEGQAPSSGAGSDGSLQPASTAAGPLPAPPPPAVAVSGAGRKAASKAGAGGAAAGRSQAKAALAAAMAAMPAGSAAGSSPAARQRRQQQQQQQQQKPQGRKRKASEPAGSLQAVAGTTFRPAVFSLQPAGTPPGDGGSSSDDDNAPKKKRGRPRIADGESWRGDYNRVDVKHGRFLDSEKETLKAAIVAYEEEHGMDTTDHTWLLAATANKRKGAVSQIAAALPSRTRKAVWACLVRMLSPNNYKGPWTEEEDGQLKELVDEKGKRWKEIGGLLGRLPESCRDRWRFRWLVPEANLGPWSEEEIEKLQQAVERVRALKGAQGPGTITCGPSHEIAREKSMFELDGINWEVVAVDVGTRNYKQCLQKWYDELAGTGPGDLWDTTEDKTMILKLFRSGATEPYEVDWGRLVKGRTAAAAYKRWRLLMKVVPSNIRWDLAPAVEYAMGEYPSLRKELKAAKKAAKQAREEEEQEDVA